MFDLTAGRDFSWDGVIEAAEVLPGDPAPDGSGPLELARGVEIGHIFQLGRKYAEALDLRVLDENGKLVTVTMGSYGIGPSRLVASNAENTYDDRPKVSPGVKFKDAELIGVPTILVVGKGLAEGTVEIKDRRTGDRQEVPVEEAVEQLIRIAGA